MTADFEGTKVIHGLVEQLIARMRDQHKRVVIIGDVMVDRWVHGRLAECQDGCPKFVQESVFQTPGGAANAERSLTRWGVNTSLYGWAHNDCPVKTRYLVDDRIVFRADDDISDSGLRNPYTWAHELALEMVALAGSVLLSDYDKGFLTPEFIRVVAGLCRSHGIPCVADAKRGPEVYEGCIIKANYDWSCRNGHQADVITRGALPPFIVGDSVTYLPDQSVCVNHVGAGDCFAAHLALALAYGFPLRDAAALAHSAGRVYVAQPHNYPPTPAEIEADMASAT